MRKRYIIYLVIVVAVIFSEHQFLVYREGEAILDRMIAERDNNATRVYLLLIDAADPQIISYLIDQGQLPNFKRLKEEGAYGELQSFVMSDWNDVFNYKNNILSLPVIATIFTGKSPEEHLMKSHIFQKEGPSFYYPFQDMPVPAIWNIANYYGLSVGIVGTQGNFPAEHINGFILSGDYVMKSIAQEDTGAIKQIVFDYKYPDRLLVFPESIITEIEKNVLLDKEDYGFMMQYNLALDFPSISETGYLRNVAKLIDTKQDNDVLKYTQDIVKSNNTAYYVALDDYSRLKYADYLYRKYHPSLFITYTQGLDFFGGQFKPVFQNGSISSIPKDLTLYYKFYDDFIRDILGNIAQNTILIVLSDHGSFRLEKEADKNILVRGEKGLIILCGPNIEMNSTIEASVYDITPTLLYLLKVPIGSDFQGKVLQDVVDRNYIENHPVSYVKTYGKLRTK